MKKLLLLFALFLVVAPVAAQEDDIDTDAVLNRVLQWDKCHRQHNAEALDTLYCAVCLYYGTDQTHDFILNNKRQFFAKHPDYTQRISDVEINIVNGATIDVNFIKQVKVKPTDKWKTYKAYLHLIGSASDWYVSWESDETTDANLGKREKSHPRGEIMVDNTTPLADIFNDKNVGKDICADYWSLVGFEGDAVEGPLAAAMISAGVIGARNSICGTLRKGDPLNPQASDSQSQTYYCGGTCSGGEFTHRVLWIYNKVSGKLSVYPNLDAD
ncbi:MAG: hypothetical protein J5593_05390 [Bacteroidaceae bacterium]|nr:hypothetical protein [Bacteroidaceae bacterium]